MKIQFNVTIASRVTALAGALFLSCALGSALDAAPQPEQKGFDTSESAVELPGFPKAMNLLSFEISPN